MERDLLLLGIGRVLADSGKFDCGTVDGMQELLAVMHDIGDTIDQPD